MSSYKMKITFSSVNKLPNRKDFRSTVVMQALDMSSGS